jgi:hypothetical protein
MHLKSKYSITEDWFHRFSIHRICELIITGDSSMIYEYRKIYHPFERRIIICFKKIEKIEKIEKIKRIEKIEKIKRIEDFMFNLPKLYHISTIKVDLKTFSNKNTKQEYEARIWSTKTKIFRLGLVIIIEDVEDINSTENSMRKVEEVNNE